MLLALAFGVFVKEPPRGSADQLAPTLDRATATGLLRNRAYWPATLGMAALVFSIGGISVWMPTFFVRHGGYSLATAGELLGGITVIDGIAGTAVGGWLAQRWLRTNHRALYLLSAWSVILTLPLAALVFFGPVAWSIPALFAAEFFLFLNTGPLNAAICNSVSAGVRSSAIA